MTLLLPRIRSVVVKVASRCNLNCTYCYVYNALDSSWQRKPKLIDRATITATAESIRAYCARTGQARINVTLHGGEPFLLGALGMERLLEAFTVTIDNAEVTFGVQTNGTLFDADWARVLRAYSVHLGVSIDGNQRSHDAQRVDHAGNGSYDLVSDNIRRLLSESVPTSALCVIPLGHDPLPIHEDLQALGLQRINYLIPDVSAEGHETLIREHGPRPVARYLIALFDHWWMSGTMSDQIPLFEHIARLILGGRSEQDIFGGGPYPYVFIETDGGIEGLDVLKTCGEELASTGLSIHNNSLDDFCNSPTLAGMIFRGTFGVPGPCSHCSEAHTCGGGYIPHRFHSGEGDDWLTTFNHPSLWCDDLLALFRHVRLRLDVSPPETLLRRRVLTSIAEEQ